MTNQTKHTPGQWTVARSGFERRPCIVARRAGRPVTVASMDCGNKDEDEANARLIAAAPELLEALKVARECIAYCRRAHKDTQSGEGFPVEMLLDAAIAKTESAQ